MLEPDAAIYTIIIKGYADAGRIEDCFSLLNEMTDQGLVPDTVCYYTLLKALCDAGHLDEPGPFNWK
jgi:pentatricopeptide repeat protein